MSAAPPGLPATVSLADEEAVRRILVDTLFGFWRQSTFLPACDRRVRRLHSCAGRHRNRARIDDGSSCK